MRRTFNLKRKVYVSLFLMKTKYRLKGSFRIVDNRTAKYWLYEPNDLEVFHSEKKTLKSLKLTDIDFLEKGEGHVIYR